MVNSILNLTRPLILTDFETTGKNPKTARIVEIAYRVFPPNEISYGFEMLVNPGVPIPKEATEIHGITDEMVKDAPTFKQLLHQYGVARADQAPRLDPGPLMPLLSGNADFAGFNVRYDMEVFAAELARERFGLSFDDVYLVDAFRLWQVLEPRTLSDAVRHFLKREHKGAHGALADVDETGEILEEQLRRLFPLVGTDATAPLTVEMVHNLCFPRDPSWIDDSGRFAFDANGDAVITFGKYTGTLLSKLDKGFLRWMLNQNFTEQCKLIARNALEGRYPRRG